MEITFGGLVCFGMVSSLDAYTLAWVLFVGVGGVASGGWMGWWSMWKVKWFLDSGALTLESLDKTLVGSNEFGR